MATWTAAVSCLEDEACSQAVAVRSPRSASSVVPLRCRSGERRTSVVFHINTAATRTNPFEEATPIRTENSAHIDVFRWSRHAQRDDASLIRLAPMRQN
jgi:hypothetical protein